MGYVTLHIYCTPTPVELGTLFAGSLGFVLISLTTRRLRLTILLLLLTQRDLYRNLVSQVQLFLC